MGIRTVSEGSILIQNYYDVMAARKWDSSSTGFGQAIFTFGEASSIFCTY